MFGLCSPLPMLPVPWKLKEVAWDDATSTVAHDPEKVPARMQETPFKEDVETILAKGKKKRRPAKLCPVVFAIFFQKIDQILIFTCSRLRFMERFLRESNINVVVFVAWILDFT